MDCMVAREHAARYQSGFRPTACLMPTTYSGLFDPVEFLARWVDPIARFLERPASALFFTHCSPMV